MQVNGSGQLLHVIGVTTGSAYLIARVDGALVDSVRVQITHHWVTKTSYRIGECNATSYCDVWAIATDYYDEGAGAFGVDRPEVLIGDAIDNPWERDLEAERIYNEWVPPPMPTLY